MRMTNMSIFGVMVIIGIYDHGPVGHYGLNKL